MAEKRAWTQEDILRALKELKDGKSIDLLDLPDLTPEEEAVFASRDTMRVLKEMLAQRGIDIGEV